MKNERGITLISLTIYLIAFTVIISLMATFSAFFYKNISNAIDKIDPIIESSRFIAYFTDDVNRQNIKVLECDNIVGAEGIEGCYIVFSNGVQYTYLKDNNGIYKNKAKICRKVKECSFDTSDDKTKVTVNLEIEGGKPRSNTFTLN